MQQSIDQQKELDRNFSSFIRGCVPLPNRIVSDKARTWQFHWNLNFPQVLTPNFVVISYSDYRSPNVDTITPERQTIMHLRYLDPKLLENPVSLDDRVRASISWLALDQIVTAAGVKRSVSRYDKPEPWTGHPFAGIISWLDQDRIQKRLTPLDQ
jgi:hypothetical protein